MTYFQFHLRQFARRLAVEILSCIPDAFILVQFHLECGADHLLKLFERLELENDLQRGWDLMLSNLVWHS